MEEVRILAASGMLGAGFSEASFERGISLRPHVIACDGGSTDGGPTSLGKGTGTHPAKSLKRDLRLMLKGRDRLKVPMIVGSCGTAGGDAGVDRVRDIVLELAREEGLIFKLAIIRSEQSSSYLIEKFRAGRILPLANAPEIDEGVFSRSEHVVGMMGPEPIMEALKAGADVVLAGRSSDTSLYAAYPLMQGAAPGPVWHAAKVMECGASASVNRKRPDSMFAWVRQDHFDIEPMDPENFVSPQSIASHSLYENADPYLITEPSGTIDTSTAEYAQINDRAVRVSGSSFRHADTYTIKLEGAEFIGYQHVIIGGVRDPYILRQLDSWLGKMQAKMKDRVAEIYSGAVTESDYSIHCRVYGRDGTMGKLEPVPSIPNEVGLVFTVTAKEESVSATIAKSFAHLAVHYPIPEWAGLITGIAYPYSPAEINRGAAYRFNLNHVVIPDSPFEMFPTTYQEVCNG